MPNVSDARKYRKGREPVRRHNLELSIDVSDRLRAYSNAKKLTLVAIVEMLIRDHIPDYTGVVKK